ncbi:MAG TPA: hypothetical protein VGH15_07830 [Caulobacteraceae bacterium]|jgi:hypothetical protein
MIALRRGATWLLIGAAVGLASCARPQAGDWRADTITAAESQIKAEVDDPAAQFSRVQVTGDDKTGQTCGYVSIGAGSGGSGKVERFIVYIDQTAGPFVEENIGKHPLEGQGFAQAWQGDCVSEGYAS